MFTDENFYSQLVGFLKITLPLAALALMSTVFLFARGPTQDSQIPYAEIEEIAREPRLSGAHVSGVADDGSIIEVSAQTARPQGDLLSVEDMTASINAADGTQIDIRAGMGEIDNAAKTARLSGLARLETSNGYEMETTGLTTNLTTGRIISDGPIEVQAPYGSLTAGQLVIETPDDSTGQVMLFQNGVRLVYTPQQ
jgi:lipopolysaccharide export system protein LptC